jgi:hypothetical protein
VRKLWLVAGVGVAWLVTFIVMGGSVLPALSSDSPHSKASSTPGAGAAPSTTPTSPVVSTPTSTPTGRASSGPGKLAVDAEALANAKTVAGSTLQARPVQRRSTPPALDFRMATYNALGASHTVHNRKRGPGAARMATGAQYVLDHDFSIVGFQELQAVQRATFMSETTDKFGLFPGGTKPSGDGDTSIAYRLDTWKLISATTIPMPYFYGETRNLPILLLRNKQTGIKAYFTNFHNPADVHGPAAKWRAIDKTKQIALFKNLEKSGYPVFVTGDMNEHRTWACSIVGPDDMRMAAGGDGRNGCTVQTNRIIDWIGASYDVTFSNYVEDRSPLVASITDHPIISTDVRIDSRDFPKSVS